MGQSHVWRAAGALALLAVAATAATPVVTEDAELTASDADLNDGFGKSVGVSGDTIVVGAPNNDDVPDNSGSAYVFTPNGSGGFSETKLTASDAVDSDWFGRVVAVSGDTVVVGAPFDDDGGSSSGSAYVFTPDGSGGWTETAKLTATDALAQALFGHAVAVSDDTVVVGAYADGAGGSALGAAYVFTPNGSGGFDQVKLTASDAAVGDQLGISVAVSGDTIVVGAHADDDGGSSSGSAYVFTANGSGGWMQTAKLTASDAAENDLFGWSVAVSGNTIVVGAYLDDDGGDASGSAYVFTPAGMGNFNQAKLTASDAATGDEFGTSVAVSGNTVVVGALFHDGPLNSGSTYVFTPDGSGGWSEASKLVASDALAQDRLGTSVAVSGAIAVAGANGDDDAGGGAGSTYVFDISIVLPNTPPTADAGPTQSIHAGQTVYLDGSGSMDDQTATGDLIYAWSFVSKPGGSTATLSGAATATPSFVADLPGSYEVQLIVTDEGALASEPGTVIIASTNLPPTADAGTDQVVQIGELAVLDGSGSSDPDSDGLTHAWALQSAPAGSTAALVGAATVSPTLTPDVEGSYVISLVVDDGFVNSGAATVEVVAIGPVFAQTQLAAACEFVSGLADESFDARGHRKSMCNDYAKIAKFVQKGQIALAVSHLSAAIARVDGCTLRGEPDPKGAGQPHAADYVTDCDAQFELYALLSSALDVITP